ncbi:MAG: carboxypeptidase-like regulatory domain-containing protein [Saprospiraceae bacterium]
MSTIYSSFSNASGNLEELKTEFFELLNFLNSREIKKKVDFVPVLNESIEKITSDIIALQKQIRLFHFSGHSGKSGLDFPGMEFKKEYVTNFFNSINSSERLQCIFLNGCENEDIVNKLTKIPVVIGTRSKIEDDVARKFTQDFFASLIKSENTYSNAFENAVAASNLSPGKVSKTRSEGGGDEFPGAEAINDYFMIVHNPEIANHKFPFNPKKTNWTKYLLLFFVSAAILMGYLFRDKLFGNVKGYSCASIRPIDDKKCNFVIGDFSTIPAMTDFTKWLYENIQEASLIKSYLNAINIDKFDKVIYNNGVNRDSLPSLCHYDFNLTGSLLQENGGYVADFNIFPYGAGEHSLKSFTYSVKSLQSLDTLITTLTEDNKSAFVLYNMCISCALKKNMPELPAILMGMAEKYNSSHNTEAYQRMQSDLADLNLYYGDTATALMSLDKISHAVGNDLALMAIERKIDLFTDRKDSVRIFDAQSELLDAYQSRINSPDQYQIRGDVNKYEKGAHVTRLERANLVVKNNNGKLKDHKPSAARDFEYLQRVNYSHSDFASEITKLRINPSFAVVQFELKGSVFNSNNQPLTDAKVSFGDVEKPTNENGVFDFGTYPYQAVMDKQLIVTHDGFLNATVNINAENISKIVLTPIIFVHRMSRETVIHH